MNEKSDHKKSKKNHKKKKRKEVKTTIGDTLPQLIIDKLKKLKKKLDSKKKKHNFTKSGIRKLDGNSGKKFNKKS